MRRNHTGFFVTLLLCSGWVLLFAPVESGAAEKRPTRISRSFPAAGIGTVILRAANAEQAKVGTSKTATVIVSGVPEGGAKGYHPADPNWKETPPEEWGLDFKSKRHGNSLVISTQNEMAYIHHHYDLCDIEIAVPAGVTIAKETRQLSEQGGPDLAPPKGHEVSRVH